VAAVVTVLLDRGTGGDGRPTRSAGQPTEQQLPRTTDNSTIDGRLRVR